MSVPYCSLWLVPQEPDLSHFQGIINRLAHRFGTLPFCPHVTLYSGPMAQGANGLWGLDVDLQQVCASLSAKPLVLEVQKLSHEPRFAKTLYVQLGQSPALTHQVQHLVATIPQAPEYRLDPHISLLYHRLDATTKQALMATISLPRPTVTFNQIQVMAAPQNFETQEHVSQLHCVHRQFLVTP